MLAKLKLTSGRRSGRYSIPGPCGVFEDLFCNWRVTHDHLATWQLSEHPTNSALESFAAIGSARFKTVLKTAFLNSVQSILLSENPGVSKGVPSKTIQKDRLPMSAPSANTGRLLVIKSSNREDLLLVDGGMFEALDRVDRQDEVLSMQFET